MDQKLPGDTIPWSPEPSVRGTWSILSSCLATLIICVWSAIHLDVTQGKSSTKVFIEKVGWLLLTLLAPEFLICGAIIQLVGAARLRKDAQTLLSYPPKPPSRVKRKLCQIFGQETDYALSLTDDPEQSTERPSNTRRHPWTLTHSFYAIMGGFVLQDPHTTPVDRYLPLWQGNGALTEHGVRLLMEYEPSLIPDIPVASIADRSKADGFAKAILVWQVLWFCLSCLNRLAQHLPLSLLEVSTLSHATCAMITYALWWRKPKDVQDPIVITGDHARLLGAWMSVERSDEIESVGSVDHAQLEQDEERSMQDRVLVTRAETNVDLSGEDSTVTSRRWAARTEALSRYPGLKSIPTAKGEAEYLNPVTDLPQSSLLVVTHIEERRMMVLLLLLPLFTAVYGLPHFIGWNAAFSSELESAAWQIASVFVMFMGFIGLCFPLFLVTDFTYLLNRPALYRIGAFGTSCMGAFILTVYVGSRLYLTGESIRQLFALPPEAFLLPSWGNYWPHFS